MKKIMILCIAVFSIFLSKETVFAQNEINVEEILVSADKISEQPQTQISKNQIKLLTPRDIGDIFKTFSGFGVIKRGGYAMEPVFRSFKYEQINMMFDGSMKIAPACPNRMDPITTHVNPEEISKIEIIKGPYSVRYGQTLGGVINIVTNKKASTDKLEFHGDFSSGYQTNGDGKSGALQLMTGNKYFDFHIGGGIKDFGDYKSGWNKTIPSSFKSYDYLLKLGINPTNNQRIVLAWRQSFGRDIKHVALPMDTDTDDSRMLSFDYSIIDLNDLIFEFNVKAYYSDVDHVMSNKNRPNFSAVNAVSNVFSESFGGKIEAGIQLAEQNVLYAGIDYSNIAKDGDRIRKVSINMCTGMTFDPAREFTDLIWQNSKRTNFGFFIESKNKLSRSLSLIGGLRIDLDDADIASPAEDFEGLYDGTLNKEGDVNFSGNLTLNYNPENQFRYQLAVGRGVRSPKLLERYINHFSIGLDAYEYVGNPNLKPEINNQVDISMFKDGKVFDFEVNVFASYFNDYITAIVDENLDRKFIPCQEPQFAKRFVNIDEAIQYGFELSAKYKVVKNLSLEGNVYYTWAQNLDFEEPLSEIPPLSSTISVVYENQKLYAAINSRFVAEQKRVALSFNESPSDAFNTVDLKVGYKIHKTVEVDFGVNNLFDANYYEHLSRPFKNVGEKGMIFEPGRNFIFSVRLKF